MEDNTKKKINNSDCTKFAVFKLTKQGSIFSQIFGLWVIHICDD
jgi:hypothetical protein